MGGTISSYKAKNHQIVGQSQMYKSERGMEKGVKSVRKNGSAKSVQDIKGRPQLGASGVKIPPLHLLAPVHVH